MGFYDNDSSVEITCQRCKEDWPHDSEFFKAPGDRICRACKYEQRQERSERERNDPALRERKLEQGRQYRLKVKTASTR